MYRNSILIDETYLFGFVDHSKGFGGKYGVQTDRKDKVKVKDQI